VIKNLTSANSLRQFNHFKPTTSFASKVERFNQKLKLAKIGHGYYQTDKLIKWDAPCYANIRKEVFLKKVLSPSPASIPSHDAVFGYEQNEHGQIVKKKNAKPTFSGTN
jgi:hypothetical protein